MMKLIRRICGMVAITIMAFQVSAQTSKYKCLVQMSNYTGEGAYIVVSLMNPKGEYEKTLYVMGDDKQWYKTIKEWHQAQAKKRENVSAVTGASVTGGDRSIATVDLDDSKLNKGYTLRFETAVEDQKYHAADVEVPYTTEGLAQKTDGKGYIRYVRFTKSE